MRSILDVLGEIVTKLDAILKKVDIKTPTPDKDKSDDYAVYAP